MAAYSACCSLDVAVPAHTTDGHRTADVAAYSACCSLDVAVPAHTTDGRFHQYLGHRTEHSCTDWTKPEPASCQTRDPDRRFPVENCGLQSRIDHRPPTTHVSPHPTPHLRSQHVGSHAPPPQDHSGLLCAPPVNVSTMVGNCHSDPVSRPVSADSCRSRFRL